MFRNNVTLCGVAARHQLDASPSHESIYAQSQGRRKDASGITIDALDLPFRQLTYHQSLVFSRNCIST